ncbi:hypothetical protein [Herpetosiphon giganteus]|uniref:hypothetical protein n=1 Tax=Herpetosiphon giganteus TaxID=2029754 RepID=UPI00195E4FF8|nr:hypothetical protein [Herpetosiphon giganteus]MBM7845843.1 uncharacterized membrane protein (DUF2068 family) [Herpetosiphon giganteus]
MKDEEGTFNAAAHRKYGYGLWALGYWGAISTLKLTFAFFAPFAVAILRGPSCPSWIKTPDPH